MKPREANLLACSVTRWNQLCLWDSQLKACKGSFLLLQLYSEAFKAVAVHMMGAVAACGAAEAALAASALIAPRAACYRHFKVWHLSLVMHDDSSAECAVAILISAVPVK